jgi:hypothetical protein
MVVLDEIQRRNLAMAKASDDTRNLILGILNHGIPVVLAGNPAGFKFPERDGSSSQLLRRYTNNGYFRLDPADSSLDENWQILVRGMWRCQVLPEINPLTEEHFEVFFRLTAGIPGFLSNVLVACQEYALEAGMQCLTLDLIEEVGRKWKNRQKLGPMIDAFVARDVIGLTPYNDVDRDYYRRKWSTMSSQRIASTSLRSTSAISSKKTPPQVLKQQQINAKAATTRAKKAYPDSGPLNAHREFLLGEIDRMLNPTLPE